MKPVSPSTATMEDEERKRKLEAGRAKLAEYRQKKAQSDGQKKQKKKKKQKSDEQDESAVPHGEGGVRQDTSATEFSISRTLRSGETVKHDQTYTIEPESEVSTTAEDYSSEDEEMHPPVSPLEEELQREEPPGRLQAVEDELAAKSLAVEELSQELDEIRAVFGAEGVQQLQDFEAALKQRDEIITQLTANLQQARTEKDEVMREFLQLTEQSQKLQLQFQQLQAGESLRSSSISSAAADLLQTRQQLLLCQQQLEDRDSEVRGLQMQLEDSNMQVKGLQMQLEDSNTQVKGLQMQLEDKDTEVKGFQEKLLQMIQLQQKLSQMETITREAEESFTLKMQEKDLRIAEQEQHLTRLQDELRKSELCLKEVKREAEVSFIQKLQKKDLQIEENERLTSEQQQLLTQLQDDLQAAKSHLNEVDGQLTEKVHELETCKAELQTSRQKERLSSGEIQQLMGTVEELQKHFHHKGPEQGEAARKMDHLRAELDEMYGQQIVQMKQELMARHAEEMAEVQDKHSAELDKSSESLRAKWTQSAGEVNVLNARVVELQQKLQENQVLREKAEQNLVQVSLDKSLLQKQVQELDADLRLVKQCKESEKSQTTVQQELQAVISDLQAKLAAAQEASSELEAKHESEITNYQIKLEMLEREKDAVLDRMAESQEAELERLRTQLLFSHEEELSKLREDLQHESQMNMENLRDELRQVRNEHEAEKAVLEAERASLLQEIVALKDDLSQALENTRVDELDFQLKELQTEIQELRKRERERGKPGEEDNWDKTRIDRLESENKVLKETNVTLEEELKSLKEDREGLLVKAETLSIDNRKINELVEELKAEIEMQKTTFSFAEKNFEVNYQELREELEERLKDQMQQFEAQIHGLQIKPQMLEQGNEKQQIEEEEEGPGTLDGGPLVEKDQTELMEKLQNLELEKAGLQEKVEQKEVELNMMEVEFEKIKLEKAQLLKQVEMERVELVKGAERKEEELCALRKKVQEIVLRNEALEKEMQALKQRQPEDGGLCTIQNHRLKIAALEEELQALHASMSVERDRLPVLQQEEQSLSEQEEEEEEEEEVHVEIKEVEAAPLEGLLASPLTLLERERGSAAQRTHTLTQRTAEDTHTPLEHQVKIRDVLSDGRTEAQPLTCPLSMEGSDHEECRLQMEALRISLSQIHAAQLELLRENLHTHITASRDDPKSRYFTEEVPEEHQQIIQMVCDEQRKRSVDVHSAAPRSLNQLQEEVTERSAGLEVDKELKTEFQEQQELQEQQHRQEIQRLRDYYTQEIQEIEERYRNEIHLLQDRLHQLTGSEAVYSIPSVVSPDVQQDAEQGDQLDELDSVRRGSEERARDTQKLQRQREEDIAKVIVQMSVEFAQQTELARINRTCGDEEKESERLQEELRERQEESERLQEELRETHEEIMLLRNKLEMLEENHSSHTQGAEQKQVMEREEEKERGGGGGGEEIMCPRMQSMSTQTGETTGDEDEERPLMKNKEDVMSQLCPQETEEESSSDFITTERNLLRKTNEKLRQVLVEVLKTTAATEETIGRHVEALLETSSRGQHSIHRDVSSESFPSSEMVADDASVFSTETETDEGLEMSQMMLGTALQLDRVELQSEGVELQLEREEYLSSISSRLQSAVEKLLFTITETTNQLEHARVTQTELMREKFRHGEEIAELMRKQEELQERLQEEASARQRLALQLHDAEGLIDGYSGERRALEDQVRERAELQLQLEQELQVTSSRLQELEHERQNLHHQRELLHRQQEAMREGAGGRELRLVEAAGDAAPEADLLEETEKLMQEKVEVQRQAEKEHTELLQQVKLLEAELEEQVGRFTELEETHRAESSDLTQQIHALEKQLENNRRFLDEQAVDREHERDVFQQEIQKLEQQLKNPPKPSPSSDRHHREVEELSSTLKEKADWCSDLLLRLEQSQREVEEREEEIEKLESRVRELEQALIINTHTPTAEDCKQYASMAGGGDVTLEALLQTEREALDRKEKEIVNLEEQLEQFREELQNKSEEVQQLHMQLEIQRKEISTQQQELLAQTSLHTVLEQKDREITLLKIQLSHSSPDNKEVEQRSALVLELEAQVEYLRGEQERLKQDNQEEVEQLNSVIEKLQQELSHIEHKHGRQDEVEDSHAEEEYDELKQQLDKVMKEFDMLQTDHSSLLSSYERLQQEQEKEQKVHGEGFRLELEEALQKREEQEVQAMTHRAELKEALKEQEAQAERHKAELEEVLKEREKQEARGAQLRAELQEALKEREEQESQVAKHRTELEEALKEREEKDVQVVKLRAELEEALQERDEQDAQIAKHRAELEGALGEREEQEVQSAKLKVELEKALRERDEQEAQSAKHRMELEEALRKMEEKEVQGTKLKAELEEALREREDQEVQGTKLKTNLEVSLREREEHEAQSAKHRMELEEALRKMEEQEVQGTKLKAELEEALREREEQEMQGAKLKADLEKELKERKEQEVQGGNLKAELEEAQRVRKELEVQSAKHREELEEALRERMAALLVAQAQVQALEERAGSRVTELMQRVEELEDCVEEKEQELHDCRRLVHKAQEDAQTLHLKVSQLEDKLREKVAAVLVSQAQLEAVQVQTKELHKDEAMLGAAVAGLVHSRVGPEDKGFPVAPVRKAVHVGRVGLVTEKLQELEQGLSSMQKDQELQKELLTSSEEEVQKYERRLAMLMELLNQMRRKPALVTAQAPNDSGATMEELVQEQQDVKVEAAAAKEELITCRDLSLKLQEQIQLKESEMEKLERDLQKVSECSDVKAELQEVRSEAAAAKEELNTCRELCLKLQEQIQEREMTIALLKDQLHRVSGEVDSSELLQELQDVRSEAAATKEELNSYIERSLKLQEQIQVRDSSIAEMMDELQQLRAALAKSNDAATQQQATAPSQQQQHPLPSQSRKKTGKHSDGKGKGISVAKEKPLLSSKNSNGQPANTSQEPLVSRTDAGTQVEQEEVEEELEEVIGEYTERIAQMQELHAAEIMDMENRHISESDSLKRENQRLEQECNALRAALNDLRTNEPTKLDHPASSQFRDGYASDSGSDWSQRTGFEPSHLQAEFRSTPEGARRDDSDVLSDRIKTLLREVHQEGMQVLSLSELPVPEAEHPAQQLTLQAWRKEREALLDTVESLKTLITQIQTVSHSHTQDWRFDLLRAVQQVFVKEREVLKATLLSHLDQLDTRDAVIHLNQLQRVLTQQDADQREALSSLQSAERRSLLAEITHLQEQLAHLQQDTPLTKQDTPLTQQDTPLTQQPHPAANSGMTEARPGIRGVAEREWSDGERTGEGIRRDGERDEQTEQKLVLVEELKAELNQTKLELEISLKAQSKHLKDLETLRMEVSAKTAELDSLSDQLVEEQKRVRELQWTMEREKTRAERREEGEREEVEDLRLALEEQNARVEDLSLSLEEERKVSAQLRDQTNEEISKHTSLNTELQVQLETQKLQAGELRSTLQREKEMNTQLLKQLQLSSTDPQRHQQTVSAQGVEQAEEHCSQVEEGVRSVEVLLLSLQEQLTEKQSALVELMGQLEQQKLGEVQAKRAWEQERAELTRSLQTAAGSLTKLQGQTEDLQLRLNKERERGMRLERERDGLQRRVTELADRSQRDSQQQGAEWGAGGEGDRTRDWVLQQKAEDAGTMTSSSTTVQDAAGQTTGQTSDTRNLDGVISRLQLISNRINSMTSTATSRLPADGPDTESLTWLHNNIQDVLSLLQHTTTAPPAVPESAALLSGGSSSVLTERLLRQNAELTGFVSRLTEEKNELRNQLLRLEEELRRQRHLSAHSSVKSGSEGQELVLFSGERESWSREKLKLEKSLRQAEGELTRLRAEIRSDTLRDVTTPDTDNTALKRIYGKYLRAESFRKALIYQKKYLLLLLGGFQECEEATLALIARMGGQPSYSRLEALGRRRRGLMRFRSAVRVSIALSRMRFLVRRWKKAAGGSVNSPNINRNGLGQTPGIDGRNDSLYLHPSVEQYGERRGTNRTGGESPRTGHHTHYRYGTGVCVGGDAGGMLCSHLQNYDPDRALTDYISRLEALQRRLGSVQSGSSSYTQLHFGIRR